MKEKTKLESGAEIINLLDNLVGDSGGLIVLSDTEYRKEWNKIKDYISDQYFLKYTERKKLGYSVYYYDNPEYVKLTEIRHKKNTKTIVLEFTVTYGERTWSYLARIKKSELIDPDYNDKIRQKIRDKRIKYLNERIEKCMISMGKYVEELEKIEGES